MTLRFCDSIHSEGDHQTAPSPQKIPPCPLVTEHYENTSLTTVCVLWDGFPKPSNSPAKEDIFTELRARIVTSAQLGIWDCWNISNSWLGVKDMSGIFQGASVPISATKSEKCKIRTTPRFSRAQKMQVWAQPPFGGFPCAYEATAPPSPSFFSPTPLALFAMLPDGAARAGVGGGVQGCRSVEEELPPTGTWGWTHIRGHSRFALAMFINDFVGAACCFRDATDMAAASQGRRE